jgi:crotonobetainyl-CoA:carnitine CoA-transferase CaiB-like acyl-CoA transferase
MTLPLENIRVLDFGQYVAGPATAAMLGDQGAEVIRIDPPGGPRWKSPAMDTLNRRKKSIVLDLKTEKDLGIARDLIATADVLIENFRPGVMSKLGLDSQEVHVLNPRLVYVSLPGFSAEDEERAHIQAWEGVIAAASGQFTDMGLNRVLMGINTSFSPLTLASGYAAMLAATSVPLALHARETCGHGDTIEVPIAAALMEGLVYNSMYIEDCPPRYFSLREHEIDRRKKADIPLDMDYDGLQEFMDPFYRSYFCKDDRPVYVVATCHVNHCHKTLKAMGLYEKVRELGLPDLEDWYLPTSQWPEGLDCALGLYPLTKPWAEKVSKLMAEKFLEKTSFEWEKLFGKANVPVSAHRYTQEWLNSEHALASGLVHEVMDPVVGKKRQAGPVAWLNSSAEFAAIGTPAPRPDEHREEILKDLKARQRSPAGNISFSREHNWLKGVKILDMTNVIAGPTVGNTLGRFGAEVIKLYSVKPTFDPWNTVLIGLQVHRGKKSIMLDIKSDKGREAFNKMIQWADVITYNGPHRQLAPLGIDLESIKSINPNAILFHLDCWGGPKQGPRSDYVGYDDLVQAATGIMARFGGSIKTPEEHAHLGTIDVLTGFAGAFAVATALYKRQKTGTTDVARTSLAACGQLLQAPFTYDYEGREPFNEPSGRHIKGDGPLYRCYEAGDGWFFMGMVDQDANILETIDGLHGIAAVTYEKLEKFLAYKFKTREKAHWVKALHNINVGATELGTLSTLREQYSSHSETGPHGSGSTFQFTRYDDHPSGHRIDIIAPCSIRPKYAALTVPPPAEKYGKETRGILTEMGYADTEIDKMITSGVASESWSQQYLPD